MNNKNKEEWYIFRIMSHISLDKRKFISIWYIWVHLLQLVRFYMYMHKHAHTHIHNKNNKDEHTITSIYLQIETSGISQKSAKREGVRKRGLEDVRGSRLIFCLISTSPSVSRLASASVRSSQIVMIIQPMYNLHTQASNLLSLPLAHALRSL
jgi:hypothetical protein